MKKLFTLVFLALTASSIFAQDKPAGKVHGYIFGDYFYKLGGNETEVSSSQYSKVKKADQAFQFRRLYLYYDHTFSEKFAAQFLLEGNDGSLDGKDRYGIFVKTAYLEWKDVIPYASLGIGLYPTPTWSWGVSEKIWNYRSVEKTVTDFRKMGNSTDFGVALRGKFDAEGNYGYGFMIGNGSGTAAEKNKFKKYYGVLNAKPAKGFIVEAYADYEPADFDKDRTTLKGFAGYQTADITLGVEALQQIQKKSSKTGADQTPFAIALFAWAPLTNGLNGFVRYDFYNPDTKVSNAGFNENFFTVGLDYMPIKDVHIMPNLWINTFSDKSPAGVNKDADVVARVTFYFVYK